ncbi:agrin-like, partial [Cyanistes caeruleus]|uniref:agrin-like n=1 Tax=Cyanistes caeruleus TaxID=156563 RepID=UPI000CD9FB69
MSGLCSCRTGVTGMKCNLCPHGGKLGTAACQEDPTAPRSCEELSCDFGASCVEVNGFAHCECPSPLCSEANMTKVWGRRLWGAQGGLGCSGRFGVLRGVWGAQGGLG